MRKLVIIALFLCWVAVANAGANAAPETLVDTVAWCANACDKDYLKQRLSLELYKFVVCSIREICNIKFYRDSCITTYNLESLALKSKNKSLREFMPRTERTEEDCIQVPDS